MSVFRHERARAAMISLALCALAAWPALSVRVAYAATAASSAQCTPGGTVSLPDFSPLVAKYGPAVVNIEVIEKAPEGGDQGDDPLNDFFRRFGIPAPGGGQQRHEEPVRGAGSGFIVSSDGYVLTNGHVVEGASQVTVRLVDQREFRAKVVGTDERTDIAVLKIAAAGLPVVHFGDPSKLRPGEWVLAIGSPFGFDNSATAGIVSAIGRSLPTENYVPFIQTDVAVNPGNSGGPLFNLQGEVVGINSQIFSRTGGFMGVSFAIPIDVAAGVERQIIQIGHVVRGKIGVTIQEVTADLADSFGLSRPHGALVSSVQNKSPAAVAGLKAGDVVLAVDGHSIDHYGELSSRISSMRPGSEATLTLWRDRKESNVRVRVVELKEQPQMAEAGREARPAPPARKPNQLGLTIRPLAPQEKAQARTDGNLVVEGVSGAAELAGVESGDIILGVDGRRIRTVEELESATQGKRNKSIALLVQRGAGQLFLPVAVP
ncbi:MAG TPA: DegQ family serine endoprotease [Steroidobacteraceae bacterium]|nr:DegQ family serine endoprotease [Steroidobacteraceae bacterium]